MKHTENNGLIRRVADRHGVDGDAVLGGIREAVAAAQKSENSEARAFCCLLYTSDAADEL